MRVCEYCVTEKQLYHQNGEKNENKEESKVKDIISKVRHNDISPFLFFATRNTLLATTDDKAKDATE
jgi:hypothetical protein